MNRTMYPGLFFRLFYRMVLKTRWMGAKPVCKSFDNTHDQNHNVIQQIYVINLDRQINRWNKIQKELLRIYGGSKIPLRDITKRFSAIDARYNTELPNPLELQINYTLADQLFVEPNPILRKDEVKGNQPVTMTNQEIAVALSHIAVWKLIASSDHPYTLVLEDDVYFHNNFAKILDKAWDELTHACELSDGFDVLYLSYKEVKTKVDKQDISDVLFKPLRGLWWLSGYVLSQKGAKKLLGLLPVYGPVDLWINLHFKKLDVFATQKSIIEQRMDYQSDNSYSILPVLAKVGVFTQAKPLLFKTRTRPTPVFAFGRQGTGLTSLAMALSMLGYRCCSDVKELPETEHYALFSKKKSRVFDAYVNVGSLWGRRCIELAKLYRKAKFIITVSDEEELIQFNQDYVMEEGSRTYKFSDQYDSVLQVYKKLRKLSANILVLPMQRRDKWDQLCKFIECEYPTSQYPAIEDQTQRHLSTNTKNNRNAFQGLIKMQFDSSPWIATSRKEWCGVPLLDVKDDKIWENCLPNDSESFQTFKKSRWSLLDDTFPDNLSIFKPDNFSISSDNIARIMLCKEYSPVREYTSASICSRKSYLFGCFSVVIKPAKVPGLVTGVFLHRNSPRQEIDIEFLGKDTSKLLVNVYYNPGGEGANLEYGYRGTPILIDLGFDASRDFHRYSIEWSPTSIRWFVDSRLVYKRVHWDPTPIPHLPMQFYVNLWPPRSEELAGTLSDYVLPAYSDIKCIDIQHDKLPG
ncbi:MAG: family 16 glycosylhydrolase [Bacillota bacterium]|nr:family 16 glycosylhydrolase [Bacillota bacterium]MDW7676762.1 family 16 glycosylhydrolase [Bacillota bacterium]